MNDYNQDLDQTDEEILRDEVSDEALEAASIAPRGLPTLMHNTYCFACPSIIRSTSIHRGPHSLLQTQHILAKLPTLLDSGSAIH
jgi:hypothetical protein